MFYIHQIVWKHFQKYKSAARRAKNTQRWKNEMERESCSITTVEIGMDMGWSEWVKTSTLYKLCECWIEFLWFFFHFFPSLISHPKFSHPLITSHYILWFYFQWRSFTEVHVHTTMRSGILEYRSKVPMPFLFRCYMQSLSLSHFNRLTSTVKIDVNYYLKGRSFILSWVRQHFQTIFSFNLNEWLCGSLSLSLHQKRMQWCVF